MKRVLRVLVVGVMLWSITLLLPGANIAALFVIQGALAVTLGVLFIVGLFLQRKLAEKAKCSTCPVKATV